MCAQRCTVGEHQSTLHPENHFLVWKRQPFATEHFAPAETSSIEHVRGCHRDGVMPPARCRTVCAIVMARQPPTALHRPESCHRWGHARPVMELMTAWRSGGCSGVPHRQKTSAGNRSSGSWTPKQCSASSQGRKVGRQPTRARGSHADQTRCHRQHTVFVTK